MHAHAERIQEQDGLVQGAVQAQRRLERDMHRLTEEFDGNASRLMQSNVGGAGGGDREAQQLADQLEKLKEEREAVVEELDQRLKTALDQIGGYSENNRVQLRDCSEMVLKLGNKAIQEAEKVQRCKDLVEVMQGRITELSQLLQEERRERRVFQEETIGAFRSGGNGGMDNSLLFTPVSEGGAGSSWHSDGDEGRGAAFETLDENEDGVLDREEFARLNQVFKKDLN